MDQLRYRRPARELNIRKRFAALTTNEKHRAAVFRRVAFVAMLKSSRATTDADRRQWKQRARILWLRYCSIALDTSVRIERPMRLDISIDSFSSSTCWNYFECRKEDLFRLLRGLDFDDRCVLENRSVMSGEEVLLRGLYELVTGNDQYTCAESIFGRDQSQQSRAFKYFVDHIYSHFLHLLTDNLEWWFVNGFVAESRTAIQQKLYELNLDFDDENENDIGFFIDCNCMDTARVGGGPRTGGADADRWDDNVQRAFYNGWKSIHGLKHQTVDLAHGFTVDMFGPTSLRRNDLTLLAQSEINNRLRQLQLGNEMQVRAYGDSIYPHLSHVYSSHGGDDEDGLTDRQKRENAKRKRVRVAIEWNYGVTANLFGYFKNIDKLKVMNGGTVCKVYTVATLLRNCHVALYGGISSNYFGLRIPDDMLERYLRVDG